MRYVGVRCGVWCDAVCGVNAQQMHKERPDVSLSVSRYPFIFVSISI